MGKASGVERFWQYLGASDGEGMARCYSKDATFEDAVFRVRGDQVGAMWRMLLPPGSGVKVTTGPLKVERNVASGVWEAWYVFPATGRRVHNKIRSEFRLEDGVIVEQRDRFPFWKWSRMALGWRGILFGWAPPVRNAVRRRAMKRLQK